MNPFTPWLKRLIGHPCSIAATYDTHRSFYDGIILVVEDGLCLMKRGSKIAVIKTEYIVEVGGPVAVLKKRMFRKAGETPMYKWLKRLENKDVRLVTYSRQDKMTYFGVVVRAEKEMCVFKKSNSDNTLYVFESDNIVELICDESELAPRVVIEIEEVDRRDVG